MCFWNSSSKYQYVVRQVIIMMIISSLTKDLINTNIFLYITIEQPFPFLFAFLLYEYSKM